MEEKIIREKNRTSMKKIANDDDRLKEQKKVEVVVLWTVVCGAATGWSRGDYMEFVLACWEKIRRRKERLKEIKIKFFTY